MTATPRATDWDGWVRMLGVNRERRRARAHLMKHGPLAVPALRAGLRHRNPAVRVSCVNILDFLLDDDAVADIVAALDDSDPTVQRRALHALACDACKTGECRPADDVWVPRAFELLRDPDPDVRAGAIDALAKASERRPEVGDALLAAIESEPLRALRTMARRRAWVSASA